MTTLSEYSRPIPTALIIVLLFLLPSIGVVADSDSRLEQVDKLISKAEGLESEQKYEEALDLVLQAKDTYAELYGPQCCDVAAVLNHIGALHSILANADEAEECFLQALGIYERELGKGSDEYLITLSNLAVHYGRTLEPAKQEACYIKIMEISPSLARNKLGMLYKSWGRFADAEDCYKLALAELEDWIEVIDDPQSVKQLRSNLASVMMNLAIVYKHMERYAEAEEMMLEALDLKEELFGKESLGYKRSHASLAGLYWLTGRLDEAQDIWNCSLPALISDPESTFGDRENALQRTALLMLCRGEYDESERLVKQVLEMNQRRYGRDRIECCGALLNLAALYGLLERVDEAVRCMDEAAWLQHEELHALLSISDEQSMSGLVSASEHSMKMALSLALLDPDNYSEWAFQWISRRKGIVFDTLCGIKEATQVMDQDPIYCSYIKDLRLAKSQLSDLQLTANTNQAQISRIEAECVQLERLIHSKLSDHARHDDVDITVDAIRAVLPPDSALVEIVKSSPVKWEIDRGYLRTHPARYYAFVLIPDSQNSVDLLDLGSAEDIEDAIESVRDNLQGMERRRSIPSPDEEKMSEEAYMECAQDLYRLVFAPIREHLGDSKKIFLAPDGELNRISFEALVDDDDKYLLEQGFVFNYISTGRDLLKKSESSSKGSVVFAGPDYNLPAEKREEALARLFDGKKSNTDEYLLLASADVSVNRGELASDLTRGSKWEELPSAESEAKSVEMRLDETEYGPVETFQDDEALEDVLKRVKSPRLLHICTHGFFLKDREESRGGSFTDFSDISSGASVGMARLGTADNPLLRSGLVLAGANAVVEESEATDVDDGWVTAEEISTMDLAGTELVVLSACQSGLGDIKCGEGVYGLRRAFFYAGAKTLVTSLFKVADKETAQLMNRFYDSLRSGKSKLESLHNAQVGLMKSRRLNRGVAHPYYWSAFVLVGESD